MRFSRRAIASESDKVYKEWSKKRLELLAKRRELKELSTTSEDGHAILDELAELTSKCNKYRIKAEKN